MVALFSCWGVGVTRTGVRRSARSWFDPRSAVVRRLLRIPVSFAPVFIEVNRVVKGTVKVVCGDCGCTVVLETRTGLAGVAGTGIGCARRLGGVWGTVGRGIPASRRLRSN